MIKTLMIKNSAPRVMLVLLLGAVLSACQTYSLVSAQRVTVAKSISVEPTMQWNKRVQDKQEHWTVDGERLQELRFYGALEDGDKLIDLFDEEKQKNMPGYRSGMSFLEIREFVESSFRQAGLTTFETVNFEPEKFGGRNGFRIEFAYTDLQGLPKLGFAVGANVDKKLHMVLYHGAKLHYYKKYLREAEDIIRSITFASLDWVNV